MRATVTRFARTHGLGVAALLGAMTVIAVIVPSIESPARIGPGEAPAVDAAGTPDTTDPAVVSPTSAASTTTSPPATTRPPVTSAPVPATDPPATDPPTTDPPATTAPPTPTTAPTTETSLVASSPAAAEPPATSDPDGDSADQGEPAPVELIRTVPPVPDLIVLVDGRPRATDADGVIELEPGEYDAEIEVIGLAADPPVERVALMQWSDGNRELSRDLADANGPELSLGLEVRVRVVVELGPSAPAISSARFVGSDGVELEIEIDVPTWVARARPTLVDGALVTDELEYRFEPGDTGLRPYTYQAEPEATWVIGAG